MFELEKDPRIFVETARAARTKAVYEHAVRKRASLSFARRLFGRSPRDPYPGRSFDELRSLAARTFAGTFPELSGTYLSDAHSVVARSASTEFLVDKDGTFRLQFRGFDRDTDRRIVLDYCYDESQACFRPEGDGKSVQGTGLDGMSRFVKDSYKALSCQLGNSVFRDELSVSAGNYPQGLRNGLMKTAYECESSRLQKKREDDFNLAYYKDMAKVSSLKDHLVNLAEQNRILDMVNADPSRNTAFIRAAYRILESSRTEPLTLLRMGVLEMNADPGYAEVRPPLGVLKQTAMDDFMQKNGLAYTDWKADPLLFYEEYARNAILCGYSEREIVDSVNDDIEARGFNRKDVVFDYSDVFWFTAFDYSDFLDRYVDSSAKGRDFKPALASYSPFQVYSVHAAEVREKSVFNNLVKKHEIVLDGSPESVRWVAAAMVEEGISPVSDLPLERLSRLVSAGTSTVTDAYEKALVYKYDTLSPSVEGKSDADTRSLPQRFLREDLSAIAACLHSEDPVRLGRFLRDADIVFPKGASLDSALSLAAGKLYGEGRSIDVARVESLRNTWSAALDAGRMMQKKAQSEKVSSRLSVDGSSGRKADLKKKGSSQKI